MKKTAKNNAAAPRDSAKKDGVNGCLQCGDTPPAGKKLVRGLCEKHIRRFTRNKNAIKDDADARLFEEKAVERGYILPAEKGGRKKDDEDVFEKLRLELLPEKVRKDVEEGIAASKKLTEDQKKKPGNSNK